MHQYFCNLRWGCSRLATISKLSKLDASRCLIQSWSSCFSSPPIDLTTFETSNGRGASTLYMYTHHATLIWASQFHAHWLANMRNAQSWSAMSFLPLHEMNDLVLSLQQVVFQMLSKKVSAVGIFTTSFQSWNQGLTKCKLVLMLVNSILQPLLHMCNSLHLGLQVFSLLWVFIQQNERGASNNSTRYVMGHVPQHLQGTAIHCGWILRPTAGQNQAKHGQYASQAK